jgi:hypothetical protein
MQPSLPYDERKRKRKKERKKERKLAPDSATSFLQLTQLGRRRGLWVVGYEWWDTYFVPVHTLVYICMVNGLWPMADRVHSKWEISDLKYHVGKRAAACLCVLGHFMEKQICAAKLARAQRYEGVRRSRTTHETPTPNTKHQTPPPNHQHQTTNTTTASSTRCLPVAQGRQQ